MLEQVSLEASCPPSLDDFINPIKTKMNEVSAKVDRQEPILEEALQCLDDGQLAKLVKAMDSKTKFQCSEERLTASAHVMFRELQELEAASQHIADVKNRLILLFLRSFAQEFHKEVGSVIQYNPDPFKRMIDDLVSHRKRLRSRQDNNASEPEQEASCCVM